MKSVSGSTGKRASTDWRHYWLAMGLLCAVTLALIFSVRFIFRRTAYITLPDSIGLTGGGGRDGSGGFAEVRPLDVTPETVQAVIETLSRATRYRREVTVRRTWSGGDADTALWVTVSGPWTRVDRTLYGGGIRHAVTNGAVTYLWNNDGPECMRVPAGAVSADNEQLIPTYEDVLRLPKERIALADYHRIESGIDCVYVETTQEENRSERYWISVSTGLLVAAEILLDGNSVYWMEAGEPEAPEADAFMLPDGTVLFSNP